MNVFVKYGDALITLLLFNYFINISYNVNQCSVQPRFPVEVMKLFLRAQRRETMTWLNIVIDDENITSTFWILKLFV